MGRSGGDGSEVGLPPPPHQKEQEVQSGGEQHDYSCGSSTASSEEANWGTLPSALTMEKNSERRLVVFLDYDGTLTPIVSDPSAATLSSNMREAVRRLAARAPVAVVSGRAREKIHEFVDLSEIFYAGSHGFDIDGPNGLRHAAVNPDVLPLLGASRVALVERLSGIDGVTIEDNRFALSVHWRNVAKTDDRHRIEQIVDELLSNPPYQQGLRKSRGKCVYELRPKVDWDKGKAVVYLLEFLRHFDARKGSLSSSDRTTETNSFEPPEADEDSTAKDAWYDSILPVYIGDDTTDEDAFGALKPLGGVCVLNVGASEKERPHLTKATHVLRGVADVETFLNFLADRDAEKNT